MVLFRVTLIEAGMIGITLVGIVIARRAAVERTHVAFNEHKLLNNLGAQGIPQLGMDEAHC
jgi:hypothetical protein